MELRVTQARVDLWSRVIRSTPSFSGMRMRNAAGWRADL